MKREELKYFDCNEDSYDSCGFKFEPMEVYDKAEADSVMDAMEAEIKELKRANRAHLIELGDAEKCFEAKEACIKELEAENKALRFNLEDWKHKAEEMEVEKLQERIKELNAENIVKDMVGAELHNENKALRYNLDDWKHKAEEMELTAKSFDAEIARSHERIQKLTNENADFVMEVEKLQERIKELEDKVQMKDFFWEGSGLSKRGFKNTIEVANYIEDLEFRQPKWVSVEERLPTTDDYDEVLVDVHDVSDYPIAGVERIRTIQFYTDSIAYDADNNCGIFKNVEGMEKCWFTKWMPLPPPPTTEESSSVKEEK